MPATRRTASPARRLPPATVPARAAPPLVHGSAPERWALKAGDAATATLNIPPDAARERRFEISCAMTVGVPADATRPWHQMTVQANGALQWRRRVDSANPGEYDGLEVRFARTVPVGEALRITVALAGAGVRRRSLDIEADEQR